jgi:hypothetical protein
MSAIEERIRQGLDVEVSVSADAMLDAAAAGVRQRRRRRTTAIVVGSVAAVAVVAVAIVAGGASPHRKSEPPPPIKTPEVEVTPALSDWFADLESDGTTLYLTTHRCPGKVSTGHCTPKEGFWNGRAPAPMKAYPVTLWRYADTTWERLGSPGVSSYAEMKALPDGLVFVPRNPETQGDARGPLRVSLDRGETWADWQLPKAVARCDWGEQNWCNVAIAGDYVVAANGDKWARRNITSGDWEDVSPPARTHTNDFDDPGYGLLVLDDGTLVATANSINPALGGTYRVSRDFGSTWSKPHDNPGDASTFDLVDGSTAYATCWELVPGYGGDSSTSCGYYRSTDLTHWTKLRAGDGPALDRHDQPVACARATGRTWRFTDSAVRVGDFVFAISSAHFVNGHEAARKELQNLDAPHRLRHVLEFSTDDCQTWEPMID